jgi:hypothetical protein
MNDKDSIERELRDLLSVDPLPGFEERVRARVRRERKVFSWNFRLISGAAAVVAAIIAAVLVFQPQRASKPAVTVTTSAAVAPSPIVEPEPQPRLPAAHRHRVTKVVRPEPQLIIAANEASAMRRLLSGEITELPPLFHPDVKELQIAEPVVEPLPAPVPVVIDPLELPLPAAQQDWRCR